MLIGLCGEISAGKSTVARRLSRLTGVPLYSFAKPLKEACRHLFGIDPHDKDSLTNWFGEQLPRCKMRGRLTVRDLLVYIGEMFREANPDFWIRYPRTCIIDDVRHLREAEHIRACGGEVYRVVRPGVLASERPDEQEQRLIQAVPFINIDPEKCARRIYAHRYPID